MTSQGVVYINPRTLTSAASVSKTLKAFSLIMSKLASTMSVKRKNITVESSDGEQELPPLKKAAVRDTVNPKKNSARASDDEPGASQATLDKFVGVTEDERTKRIEAIASYMRKLPPKEAKNFYEKTTFRMDDFQQGTIFVLTDVTAKKGKFGSYPLCSFHTETDGKQYEGKLYLPAKQLERLEKAKFPVIIAHGGHYTANGKECCSVEYVDETQMSDTLPFNDETYCLHCGNVWNGQTQCYCQC